MAASLRLTLLVFVTLLVSVVVRANTDSCGSVFETHVDHALFSHIMGTAVVNDEFECQLKCLGNNSCKSFNVHPDANNIANRICELNNKTRQMKPGDFKWKKGSSYYGSVQVSCMDISRDRNRQTKSGQCDPGYKGKRCQTPTSRSCKDIRDLGHFKKDGEYWTDPANNGKPLKVFCDMTTDGGGWLLVSSIVFGDSSSQVPVMTSYRGINSSRMVLTKSAMNELRTHLSFTQMRFHCSKQQGRTFHVTTAANSTGEAVVQYFSGQTDVQPASCGSFVRMENDDSLLAGLCNQWGKVNGVYKVGKWGHGQDQDRLYTYPAFVVGVYHWFIDQIGHRFCDDSTGGPKTSGDFWKVYVR